MNSSTPLVTICVPTIGRLDYIERVLADVDSQTYPNREVLILDNGCPVEARAVILQFAASRSHVSILRTEARVPMFANFNRGIEAASGDYVAFFHDDDIYHPRFLERHVAELVRRPTAAFAGGNYALMDAAGRRVRTRRLVRRTDTWTGRRFILDLMRRGRCALPTPGLVFRRSAIAAGKFDETLPMNWGDFIILMRMAEEHDVAVLQDVTYGWRVHGQNFSNVPFSMSVRLRTQVLLAYCDEYEARHREDAAFTSRLRRFVEQNHRRGLAWGWLAASDERDAEECLQQLRGTPGGAGLASVLAAAGRVGLSLRLRRNALPLMRRLSEVSR